MLHRILFAFIVVKWFLIEAEKEQTRNINLELVTAQDQFNRISDRNINLESVTELFQFNINITISVTTHIKETTMLQR